jgi:hypothetical protein
LWGLLPASEAILNEEINMDKGKLYTELVKQNKVKKAISIIKSKKNNYSDEEVKFILTGKKKVEKKLVSTKSVEKSTDTGIPEKAKEVVVKKKKKKNK